MGKNDQHDLVKRTHTLGDFELHGRKRAKYTIDDSIYTTDKAQDIQSVNSSYMMCKIWVTRYIKHRQNTGYNKNARYIIGKA